MDNKFSTQRVAMLLRLYWANEARRYFMGFIILLAALLFITVYVSCNVSHGAADFEAVTFFLIMPFCMAYSASIIGKPQGNKPKCIDYMMTPASTLEKFTARCLIYIVGFFIVAIVGMVLIDFMQYHIASLFFHTRPDYFFNLCDIFYNIDNIPIFLTLVSFVIFSQSLFALGGVVWPKHGLWVTLAYIIVMNIAINIAIQTVFIHLTHFVDWCKFEYINDWRENIASTIFFYALTAIGLALAAFNYTVAYFRLKEAEIVQRW